MQDVQITNTPLPQRLPTAYQKTYFFNLLKPSIYCMHSQANFNFPKFCILYILHLYVLYVSQSKERILFCTILTN
jgi:hypothetical protein